MKKKQTILAGAAVLLVLAAAFWYGGDAPGLQGWSAGPGSDRSAVSSQPSPAAPSGASSSAEGDASAPAGESGAGSASGGDARPAPQEPGPVSQGQAAPESAPEESTPAPGAPAEPEQSDPPAAPRPEPEDASAGQSAPPQEPAGEGESTACRISIDCSAVLRHLDWLESGKEDILPAGGILLAETEVEPEEGETAFSLLQRVTREQGIHLEASFTPGTGSAYVEGIGNLYEFDCGQRSGWLYLINGVSPGYSSSEYVLEPGDRVEWVYTCDMGQDVGASAGG